MFFFLVQSEFGDLFRIQLQYGAGSLVLAHGVIVFCCVVWGVWFVSLLLCDFGFLFHNPPPPPSITFISHNVYPPEFVHNFLRFTINFPNFELFGLFCFINFPILPPRWEEDVVTDVLVQYFDTISAASSLCILKTGFLFAASESASPAFYQFLSMGDDEEDAVGGGGQLLFGFF